MKTVFYINGKKTTRKAVAEVLGKEKVAQKVKEAKEGFMIDPLEEQSFYTSAGMLTIEFR